MKSHELGMLEFQSQVTEHHQGLDLSFLDEVKSEEKPSDGVATPFALVEVVPALASKAAPAEPITVKPLAMSEATLFHPTTMAESSMAVDPKEVKN